MGYQALLFCPDEKIARVVTQVFTELDFSVDPVSEPFAAVKKLMAQRFDAIVVDCDHEQNATLLFKSARNSSSNQNSLAFALVEGQAGVAKAYRIGANLVLTKPINMEQAKGTLRVARGLLRKGADTPPTAAPATAVSATPVPATPAKPAPAAASAPAKSPVRASEPIPQASNKYESPEFEPALPAAQASAKPEKTTVVTPAPQIQSMRPETPSAGQHPDFISSHAKPAISQVGIGKKPSPTIVSTQGAAAAPAPAKESPPEKEIAAIPTPSHELTPAPTFSALGQSDTPRGSGGSAKIVAIAAAIIVVAGMAYFGWVKFGKNGTPATAPSAATTSGQPTTTSPSASSGTTETVPTPSKPSSTAISSPQTAKPSALASTAPAIKSVIEPEPAPTKPEPAPIRVKSEPSVSRVQKPATEESAPQVPNPLAVASSNDQGLSKIVASAPAAMPSANLGTLKISQGVSQGLVIKRVQPVYPRSALTMHVQGAVQLEATINKEGGISNLKIIKGEAVLGRAAMDAVRQWRYKPYYLDGHPVEIETQITVNFKLPD